MLGGGHSAIDRKSRVAAAQEALRKALPGWSDPEFDAYAARHYPAYWLKVDLPRQIAHAKLLHAMARGGAIAGDRGRDRRLSAASPKSPSSRPTIRGCCRSSPAPAPARAAISSTRRFSPRPTASRSTRSSCRAPSTATTTNCGAPAASPGDREGAARRDPGRRDGHQGAQASATRAPTPSPVAPEVTIDNSLSQPLHGARSLRPRPAGAALRADDGALSNLNLNIGSAHIVTFGEKAVDSFYVTDLTGREDHLAGAPGGDQAPSSGDFRIRGRTDRGGAHRPRRLIFRAPSPDIRPRLCRNRIDDERHALKARANEDAPETQTPDATATADGPPGVGEARRLRGDREAERRERRAEGSRICARWPKWRTCAAAPSARSADARAYGVTAFARDMLTVADNLAARAGERAGRGARGGRRRRSRPDRGRRTDGARLAGRARPPRRQATVAAGREVRPQFPSGDVRGARPKRAGRHGRPRSCRAAGRSAIACCARRWSASPRAARRRAADAAGGRVILTPRHPPQRQVDPPAARQQRRGSRIDAVDAVKGEPRGAAERHRVARGEAERAGRAAARDPADPEQRRVAKRERDDRRGAVRLRRGPGAAPSARRRR